MGNGRENPSFSSTLLDSIYRSIDESNGSKRNEDLSFFYRDTTMRKKLNNHNNNSSNNNKVFVTRQSRVEFDDPMLLNSSSTNSDSSSGGGFSISSSESDSFYSTKSWPKPIRTGTTPKYEEVDDSFHASTQKTKQSRALKIYSELKKVKQPISPGAKLASFINSLFNSANAKKKNSSKSTKYEEKTSSSACSSASSFSRSCFSMTSRSSRNNVGGGTKRSVRFCLDDEEDSRSRPCGQIKILHENELQPSMRKPIKVEEDRRVAEAAKEILNSYWKKKDAAAAAAAASADDEDDDVSSYASSDLFELDNLKTIGNERYLEELPVYETTHFDTNRAIAKGLIL